MHLVQRSAPPAGPAVQCMRMRLHGVVGRLDRRHVDPAELGRRLEVAPDRARLAEPGHLRPPPGLLGHLRELRRVAAPAVAGLQLRRVGRRQAVQAALRRRPLRLALLPAVLLLRREGRRREGHLVLDVVPGPAAKHLADGELEQVQGHERHQAVEPDHARPAPPDGLHLGEPRLPVDGNQGGDLKKLNHGN